MRIRLLVTWIFVCGFALNVFAAKPGVGIYPSLDVIRTGENQFEITVVVDSEFNEHLHTLTVWYYQNPDVFEEVIQWQGFLNELADSRVMFELNSDAFMLKAEVSVLSNTNTFSNTVVWFEETHQHSVRSFSERDGPSDLHIIRLEGQ